MHQTRAEVPKRYPLPRKGTKYVVVPTSHKETSVPVLIAVRDMLNLARTTKEVKEMIKQKLLKINGRVVEDFHESVKLFNILEAGKDYRLTLTETGKFTFEESKKERVCKVIGKKMLAKGVTQINLHDGSNVLSKESINPNDTLYLDFKGAILRHSKLEKGKNCFIIGGSFVGKTLPILDVKEDKVLVRLPDGRETFLRRAEVIVL